MLYVTTRNNRDAYTVQHVLKENRGQDGGLYLPFRIPKFSPEELEALKGKPFNQRVADILNLFFSGKLTGWDLDFCIGRYPVRLTPLRHRILMAETWHNPDWNYERMLRNVSKLIFSEVTLPGNWVSIAVRIAVLFGIFGELEEANADLVDISVVSGDFSAPISAWYAREMGLPIGNIVCCCNENNDLWDLICHGQMRTDSISIPTLVPEADVAFPVDLERLIFACGGTQETERYLDASRCGRLYSVSDAMLSQLRRGLFVSVVSSHRIESTIPNMYKTHEYLLSPGSALAYAGLMDYRVKSGVTRPAIVLCDRNPVCDAETVAGALGISAEELKRKN